MLSDFTRAEKVYIACGYTDIRKGIDGLAAMVQQEFELDPFTNTLFLFCGRLRDRIKGLYWEGDGFILLYVGCLAHVRRKFNDALEVSGKGKKSPTVAQGVAYCTQLFKIEEQLKDLTPEERQIKHPPAKPVDFHMRAKPSVPRGHVKRVIRSASCVETVTCCP